MPTSSNAAGPVLVVGATGRSGSQVVGDTTRQTEVFGQPPTTEDVTEHLAAQLLATAGSVSAR